MAHWSNMLARGDRVTVECYNSLIRLYGKKNNLKQVLQVPKRPILHNFRAMTTPFYVFPSVCFFIYLIMRTRKEYFQ